MNEQNNPTPGQVIKQRTPEQQQLKNAEMHEQTKAFAVILEIIVIFAMPAIAVALAYNMFDFSKTILYLLLGVTFMISWALVIMRVKKVKQRLDEIRQRRQAIEDIDQSPTYLDEEND